MGFKMKCKKCGKICTGNLCMACYILGKHRGIGRWKKHKK